MTIPDIHIGDEIKKRFDKSGLTQKEFGSRIGMPQQNVCRVFKNESIDTKRLVAVCKALQFNFFTLYTNPSNISIDGDNNQLNESGSYGNINNGDAVLKERIKMLEAIISEKNERIQEFKERIDELKTR